MKKKILLIASILILLAAVCYYLMFYVLSGVQTSFAKACYRVEAGIKKEEAKNFLAEFENKNNVTFEEKNNILVYVTPGFSGDFQCYVHLNEDGIVKSVTKIFD